MDSFFKAAVCDLDKLLDDFELNTEELDCRNVFLKPSVFPFSSLPPQAPPPEPSPVPPNLPDLNQLRYGSSPSCPDASSSQEVKGQPLTTVDLLSSVDRGPTASSAPPCPDRALKPVCDLVSDTGSAVLARANGHDAFSELDLVEEQMAAEEEEEVKEEEALLVDFDSPVVAAAGDASDTPQAGEYSASLSLLDVILPAAVERSADSADREDVMVDPSDHSEPQGPASETASESQETSGTGEADSPGDVVAPADGEAVGLSCLPLAVSMCGALVNAKTSGDDPGPAAEPESENAEDVGEDVGEDGSRSEEPADSAVSAEGGASPQQLPEPAAADFSSGENPEPSPVDPPEFGFEYLPESDQAELLVTDEELDAFLQAQAESEQDGGGGGGCFCSSSAGLPQPESLQESDLEHSASAEDDRTTCSSADAPQIPRHQEIEASAAAGHAPSSISSDQQQPSYGGARPKQLHCQTSRPAPAGREEEEDEEEEEPPKAEEEEPPAADPAPQENQDYSVGYDELSEPPPYPGEPPSDGGSGSAAWRRGGGAEEPGSTEPVWVPDADAPNCMSCQQRFTFTKRRHHCRACGKVYCAVCCSRKCKLKYLEKEARVCNVCFDTIHRAQALERMMSPTGPSPNPNVPSEYCSTIPPLQQARAAGTLNSPPPTVMVPVSVLKHPSNDGCPREQKRVWFADGILPNGEVADTTKLSVTSRRSSQDFAGVAPDQSTPDPAAAGVSTSSSPPSSSSSSSEPPGGVDVVRPPVSGPWDYALLSGIGSLVQRVPSLLPDSEDQLPPLLITTGEDEAGDVLVEESPAPCQILHLLEEGGPRPLSFVLNANLLVNVKLVTYGGRQCWCFGSNGLQALGQRELVFVLESLPEEKTLPRDLFTLYLNVYQDAQRGKLVEELDNMTFTSSFLGSKDHGGMLFFSPSCQPLDGLALPPRPFLFGILIQKLEVPWAKVFPLRLLLRLGAESSVYPTPLVSVRFRDSVYRETGHTIMNLLADLRNYQYSLSVVEGLRIHMEMGHSYIDIPKSSFTEVQKLLNSSNEHVISVGACFSSEADSHLVCFQNEDGNYQTQASSMPGKTRTVTGASFVVFNGALKASSGFIAKSSIVEDGLMVQIPPETMESLRNALRDQTDFHIACGRSDGVEVRENVSVRWVDWSSPVNAGKTSGVDGRPLDGVHSVKMQQDVDSESDGRCIRCTEVFYQLRAPDCSLQSVLSSCGVFQREMASAACSALMPHLAVLAASAINSLSLRISTQADMVEYQAGCGGRLLPQRYMNELDGALIPVIHGGGASVPQTAMDMEFTFYITHAI